MNRISNKAIGRNEAGTMAYLSRFLLHLRLPFNYVLAPLFVWGAFVSGTAPGWRFWLGFAAFHIFLYGGTNMFNSYFDRDEGPIGGLERPPPVDRGLLVGSLVLKAIGLALASFCGAAFVICYLLFTIYSVTYSHPAIRIKRRPVASAVSVFVGQGIVGYVAGWVASGGALAGLYSGTSLIAGLGGALVVSALYPLTQIYQLEEDQRRADMTLARWLGTQNAFRYILVLLGFGMAALAFVFWRTGLLVECVAMIVYFLGVSVYLWRLRQSLPNLASRDIYRRVMTFNYINSTLLLGLLGAHLATLVFA